MGRSVRQPPTTARAVLENIQEDHQNFQKICMAEEGTYGIETLKGNTQEEDGGARSRNLKINHTRPP